MSKKDSYARFNAKQTYFNGNLFRSRLEAKWAVFFVAAEIDYFHELKGYTLSNGSGYLPDFYLPSLNIIAEVKPRVKEEFEKVISELENLSKKGRTTSEYPEIPSTKLEHEMLKLKLLFDDTGITSILLDNIPKNRPYLVYDGSWKLGFWNISEKGVVNFKKAPLDLGFLKLQNTLKNKKENISLIDTAIKIANMSQFEFGLTPTEDTILDSKLSFTNLPENNTKKEINLVEDTNLKINLFKERIDNLCESLMDSSLISTNPKVYSLFKNDVLLVKILLDVLFYNVNLEIFVKSDKLITYLSLQTLTNKCNEVFINLNSLNPEKQNTLVSKTKVSRIINLLAICGIVNKLSDEVAPKNLVNYFHDNRLESGKRYKYRNDIYAIENSSDLFSTLEDYSNLLFEKGFDVYKMSYSYVYRTLGAEYAAKIFSQKQENLRGIYKNKIDFESLVTEIILDSLEKDGYLIEDKLILSISRKLVTTKKDAKEQLGVVIKNICNKYAISEQKFNKEYRDIYKPPKVKTAVKFFILESNVIEN